MEKYTFIQIIKRNEKKFYLAKNFIESPRKWRQLQIGELWDFARSLVMTDVSLDKLQLFIMVTLVLMFLSRGGRDPCN